MSREGVLGKKVRNTKKTLKKRYLPKKNGISRYLPKKNGISRYLRKKKVTVTKKR